MPVTTLQRLAAGRAAHTGETYQQALTGLRQLKPGTPPVPDAGSQDQAFLESCVLERLGRCDKDRWRYYMLPFAVRSVTPHPDEIVIRIPAEFLPDVLREILPGWPAEHDDRDTPEVYGIPGLRARHEQGRIVLARPGFPGRVAIPASRDRWRKAALVAADLNGGPGNFHMPWLTSPADWHPAEIRFTEAWPERFCPDGRDYGSSLFESQLLRRLPGLCPAPRAIYHDLWINRHTATCAIQFEWENGPSRAAVLGRLLDAEFGPGADIELLDDQTTADCYGDAPPRVKVRSAREPASVIVLRRTATDDTEMNLLAREFGETRRARRTAIEDKHGYRIHKGSVPGQRRSPASHL
jgi:hypothetical protein